MIYLKGFSLFFFLIFFSGSIFSQSLPKIDEVLEDFSIKESQNRFIDNLSLGGNELEDNDYNLPVVGIKKIAGNISFILANTNFKKLSMDGDIVFNSNTLVLVSDNNKPVTSNFKAIIHDCKDFIAEVSLIHFEIKNKQSEQRISLGAYLLLIDENGKSIAGKNILSLNARNAPGSSFSLENFDFSLLANNGKHLGLVVKEDLVNV